MSLRFARRVTSGQPVEMSKRVPGSNIEWQMWGRKDPLFGTVPCAGSEQTGESPWNDKDYYETGESGWRDFQAHWRRYGVDKRSCLEIGCGAGRITMPLAKFFHSTVAVDVSEDMIAYARRHITDPSVAFRVVDGVSLPGDDNSVAAVFSAHVFLHFDSLSHATDYFREISRVLTAGGTMMIQVPIFEWHPSAPRAVKTMVRLKKDIGDMRAWVKRQLITRGLGNPGVMRNLVYPMSYFYDTLPGLGFTDIEISVFVAGNRGTVLAFVFARKQAEPGKSVS